MDLGIAGRTAAVAAASGGLGLASARALAADGVRVAICGRHQDRLDDALASLPPVDAGPHVALVADVSQPAGAVRLRGRRRPCPGRAARHPRHQRRRPAARHVLVHALEAYPDALALNLLSVVAMCQAAVPAMREQRWGRVVAITSMSVKQPIGTLILSNTARAGATGFLKTLATEVVADGVTVNSVLPGLHATDRLLDLYGGDTGNLTVGDPADFGNVVAFVCSEHARFITGAAIPVDGGTYPGLL